MSVGVAVAVAVVIMMFQVRLLPGAKPTVARGYDPARADHVAGTQFPPLTAFVCVDESVAQHPHERESGVGTFTKNRLEIGFVDVQDADVRLRTERRAPRLARDQRHLADELARAARHNHLVFGSEHGDLAFVDHEHRVAVLTPFREELALGEHFFSGGRRDRLQVIGWERLEERYPPKQDDSLDERNRH